MNNKFIYAEYALNGIHNRNNIQEITSFDTKNIKGDCYKSIFLFDSRIKDFVEKTKSVTGYSDIHLPEYLYFDFDSEDLASVKDETVKFCLELFGNFNIPLDNLRIFFSGNKGFHIGIPFQIIKSNPQPKDNFYKILKCMAEELAANCKFFDKSIYQINRLLRMENTINPKSNLYKIPLIFDELDNYSIEEIKELAKKPRVLELLSISEMSVVKPLNELFEKWNNYDFKLITKKENLSIGNTGKKDELIELLKNGAPEGNRHTALVRITAALQKKELSYDFILEILKNWNIKNNPPLPDHRLENESLAVYNDCNRKSVSAMESEIYSMKQAKDKYEQYIKQIDSQKVTLGFSAIDKKLRGIAPGETMCILGKTSVGKSAFLQNIGLNFCKESKAPVLFFSLEMPVTSVFERTMQIETGLSGFEIESGYREDLQDIKLKANICIDQYENFYTIVKGGLNLAQIREFTKFCEANIYHRQTALILIDYLGLVKEKGNDLYEQVSKVARGLKDLAKELNVPIIYLSQITKKYTEFDELELGAARDSGSVDEASDFVLALWKEKSMLLPHEQTEVSLNLGILKNRKGGTGKISIQMQKRSLKISEYSGENNPDV